MEAHVHQLVGEDHRLFQSQRAIAGVDDSRDLLLGHVLVDQVERQAVRQDLRQQRAPDSGLHMAGLRLQLAVGVFRIFAQTHAHLGLQVDGAALVGAMRLVHVGEEHAFTGCTDALTRQVIET
jgi:hypothetical protein